MAKDKTRIKKEIGKKKINHYTKVDCSNEIVRLDKIGDTNGKYRQSVEARMIDLG